MNDKKLHTIFEASPCLTEDEILNYVNNNCSNLDRNKVEQHTINCKFCSSAVEGLEHYPSSKTYNEVKSLFEPQKPQKTITLWPYYSIAAGIALIFVIFQLQQTQKVSNLSSEVTEKTVTDSIKRAIPLANKETEPQEKGSYSSLNKAEKKNDIVINETEAAEGDVFIDEKPNITDSQKAIVVNSAAGTSNNFSTRANGNNTEKVNNSEEKMSISTNDKSNWTKSEFATNPPTTAQQQLINLEDNYDSEIALDSVALALQLKHNKHTQKAIEVLSSISIINKKYNEAQYELGIIFLAQKDTAAAAMIFNKIMPSSPYKAKSDSLLKK